MSYTALYRKFRPAVFEDVKGQEHIVTTLRNQILADRIGHAYLFCGTRGTGKTTVAKIFAKAVNCEHPVNGSPCGTCEVCQAISRGASFNVIEIDAASNNGVDDIRRLKEDIEYPPTEGRFKVFIIDEVHMLSPSAFNALLKTLEEPPSYVIFILATTEMHKIPVTILSRCQRYDFRRIAASTIADRLRELVEKEQVRVEDKAIEYIARMADGSMRDALSLLDQCIAYYIGETVTYDGALKILGTVDTGVLTKLLDRVLERDIQGVMNIVREVLAQGREIGQFIIDFTWYLRNVLLVSCGDDSQDTLQVTQETLEVIKKQAEKISTEEILTDIRTLSALTNQLRTGSQKRILTEIALIKLCRPEMAAGDEDAAMVRLSEMERRLEVLENEPRTQIVQQVTAGTGGAGRPGTAGEAVSGEGYGDDGEPRPKPELPMAVPEDIKEIIRDFPRLKRKMSPLWQGYMNDCRISLSKSGNLLFVFSGGVAYDYIRRHIREIEEFIASESGKKVRIEYRQLTTGQKFEDFFVDLEKKIMMPIVEED